jgi:drug/metabolite transporter (DMT)-like permease
MTRPNLKDPEELAAYKRELRGLYKLWRWVGLAIVVGGVVVMFMRDGQFDRYSGALLFVGWAILIAVVIQRTRYHKRRLAEPAA